MISSPMGIRKPTKWTPNVYMAIAYQCNTDIWYVNSEQVDTIKDRITCQTCGEDGERIVLQACSHADFCEACLTQWLRIQAEQGKPGRCPAKNCDQLVSIVELKYLFEFDNNTLETVEFGSEHKTTRKRRRSTSIDDVCHKIKELEEFVNEIKEDLKGLC